MTHKIECKKEKRMVALNTMPGTPYFYSLHNLPVKIEAIWSDSEDTWIHDATGHENFGIEAETGNVYHAWNTSEGWKAAPTLAK